MLVSDVLATPRVLLVDPNKAFWSDNDLIAFLNTFLLDIAGIRRDIYSQRVLQILVAGSYQQLPAGGIQFLDAYANETGAAVFVLQVGDVLHSKFKNATLPTSGSTKIVTADPRDRKGFHVFPPAPTGTSAKLDYLYAATPPLVAAMGDTYPLDPDTLAGAVQYVVGMAYDTNSEKRDVVKSTEYMARYHAWAQGDLQSQIQDEAQAE